MTGHATSDEEIYRELEAIKLRLQDEAADEAMTRESLWLLGREIRDLAEAVAADETRSTRRLRRHIP